MRTKKNIFAIVVVLTTIFTSCYWKNWDTIHTTGPGGSSTTTSCSVPTDSILYNSAMILRSTSVVDTGTKMSYSIDIAPIITLKCATNGACHSLGGPGSAPGSLGNTDFTFYGNHHSGVDQVASGDTTGSTLWSCIAHGTPYVMPISGNAPLTSCEMSKLRNWIHQGAQNN